MSLIDDLKTRLSKTDFGLTVAQITSIIGVLTVTDILQVLYAMAGITCQVWTFVISHKHSVLEREKKNLENKKLQQEIDHLMQEKRISLEKLNWELTKDKHLFECKHPSDGEG